MLRTLRHCLFALSCLLPALGGPARAQADTYALDPVHTRILVAIDHAGFSSALGTVSGATGTLRFDPRDWTSAQVVVEIPLARLDFGDEAWNRATLAGNLLDAQAHPVAAFASTRVEPLDERTAIVHGVLRLRGIEREVALEVTLNAAKRHPLPPFRRTLGFSATTVLSRADFGITAWKSVIGDTVELRIEAEATRTRRPTGADLPEDDAPSAETTPVDAQEPEALPEPEPAPSEAQEPDPLPEPGTPPAEESPP